MRTITITIDNEKGMDLNTSGGVSNVELLGALRYFEKRVWVDMAQSVRKEEIPTKETPPGK